MAYHRILKTGLIMITKSILISCCSALLLASVALGCDSASQGEVVAPLIVSGIEPGMARKEVENILGKGHESIGLGFVSRKIAYRDVSVGLDEFDVVVYIEPKSSKACLLSRACIGSSFEDILKELDEDRYSYYVKQGNIIVNGDGCWGEINVKGETVSSIFVKCSP